MSDQKIDFIDWQAQNRQDDEITEAENKYVSELVVLTFNIDKKGINIISTHNGQIVFVDKYATYDVSAGETWVCRITSKNYTVEYAMPLLKLTLSEVMNFNEQLRENILNILWKRNRSELTEMLEGRIRNEVQSKLLEESRQSQEAEIRKLNETIDHLQKELHETKFQLESKKEIVPKQEEFILLTSQPATAAQTPAEAVSEDTDEEISLSSEFVPPRASVVQSVVQPQQRGIPQIKRAIAPPVRYDVERIGEDSLRSPSFTDNRYFVHISPDYHTLIIRPNDEGPVYCIDHVIRLSGLGLVSSFVQRKYLPAEYSEIYEGMLVRL